MKARGLFFILSFGFMVIGLAYAWFEYNNANIATQAAYQPATMSPALRSEAALPSERSSSVATANPSTADSETIALVSAMVEAAANDLFVQLDQHPEFAAAYFEAHRAAIPQYYRSFLARFGATDEQVREFTDIMMRRAQDWVDIQSHLHRSEAPIATTDAASLDRASRVARDESLRELFGQTAPDFLKQHKDTTTGRELVRSLAAPAFAAGQPLSQDQSEQLIQLLAVANVGNPGGTDFETFFRQSSGILTVPQVELLREALYSRYPPRIGLR